MELPVKSSGRKTPYRIETINLSCKLDSSSSNRCLDFFHLQKSSPSNAPKLILHDVNCEARPGEITAIAGPSGAGKTTLLEILAGKISTRRVSGHILVNGRPVNSRHFRRISGYVTQEDALFPLLTVQETLMYSLLLKLPVGSQEEADVRVKEVMKDLGLDHVSNSRVGDGSNSGISGGERRRVSIGVELVHDPAILLIDEPTSGLDSASALHVITLLKSMVVSQGKTVILTIHQPGFRILQLLDRILLLSNGLVMHNGSLDLLEARIKKVGHCIPRHINVLEFAIDVTSSSVLHALATTPDNHEVNRNSNGLYIIRQPSSNLIVEDQKPLAYANSRFKEVLILGQRFCKNIFRTKQLFATRVVQALVAGFILGSIFINRGKGKNHNLDAVALQARVGFFAFSLTFLLSSTTEGLPIFLQERRILMRETSGGAYRVSSYVLSNTYVFIPFLLMVGLLFTTPVYWLIGLRRECDGFLYFSLVVWMVLLMSNSFVACFSALVPNFIMGNSVISGLMGSFFLFSGYFIAEKNIPRYWIFMHYLSLFKYPFECFMINEYGGQQGKKCIEFDGGGCIMYGAEFLKQQDFRESRKWSNLGIMLCFIVGYRLFSFLILWIRCYKLRK